MIEIKHNEYSKKFLQKILLFADSIIINAMPTNQEESNKVLASGILNIKDAILSEITIDNYARNINAQVTLNQNKKKDELKKDQKDLNLETKLDKNQNQLEVQE